MAFAILLHQQHRERGLGGRRGFWKCVLGRGDTIGREVQGDGGEGVGGFGLEGDELVGG